MPMWKQLKNIFHRQPSRKKIYIHAGTHKTGSTYLQETLYANRALLRENGVLYPETGLGIQHKHNRHAHRQIAFSLSKEDDTAENLFEPIIQELLRTDDLHTAIISYEGFCMPKHTKSMHKILKSFDEVDLHIIFVFRPHVDFAISLFREICQNLKYRPSFYQFYKQALSADHGWPWLLNYHAILQKWHEFIPKNKIHILAYSQIKNDLCHNFLKGIGIDVKMEPLKNNQRNPTLSAPLAELMRVLNFSDWKHVKLQAFGREILQVDIKNPAFAKYCEITPEIAQEIETAFKKDRHQIKKMFGRKINVNDLKLNGEWKWADNTHVEATLDDSIKAVISHLEETKQQKLLLAFKDALDQAYKSDLNSIRNTWLYNNEGELKHLIIP